MTRLKILLPLFVVVYSVTCEDLQQVKRLGWLRARQNYQYNHPPIVENDDSLLVIYDKVIDRSNRIQKNLRGKFFENSAETVSILNDDNFDATTTELLDTESATEYYDAEKSEDITEIPEEFSTTPRRRFKLAKYTYSYQPRSNPATIAYNDEPSNTVRKRLNYGFSGQRKYYIKPTYEAYESKITTGTESEIDNTASNVSYKKTTQIENGAYDEDSISMTGFRRRPGLRRLRKNKRPINLSYQDYYQSHSSDVEQTEAEINSVALEATKPLIVKQFSTSFLNKDTTSSTESNYDGVSGLTVSKTKSTRKYFRRPQNFGTGRSYDAEISLTSLETDTETENTENKKEFKQETLEKSSVTNVETLNSKSEINYDRTSDDAIKNITITTQKFYKRPQKYASQQSYNSEVYLGSANIKTPDTHSEPEDLMVEKQKTAKESLFTNSIKVAKSDETNYDSLTTNDRASARKLFKRPQKYAIGRYNDAKASLLSTNLEIENNITKESVTLDKQEALQISNVQTSKQNTEAVTKNNYEIKSGSAEKSSSDTLKYIKRPQVYTTRRYVASAASFMNGNDQTSSTESKRDDIFIEDKQKTGQISNVQSITSAEQETGYENGLGLAFQNKKNTLTQRNNTSEASFLSTNTEKEKTLIKTDEIGTAENFGTVQLSNTQTSEINAESVNNNDETEPGSTEKSQVSTLIYLRKPQIFATRRNYASGTSLSTTNTESESTQEITDRIMVTDKPDTVQISNVQASNKNIVSTTDSNNESKSGSIVNNQVNTLKYLRRPQIFTVQRTNASSTSLLSLNTKAESTQGKTDEIVTAAKLNTVGKSKIQESKKYSKSAIGSSYKSESGSTVKNQTNTLNFLRRPQVFARRRNYASETSLESTNTKTETTQSKAGEAIVANNLSSVQISKIQASNKTIEFVKNNNNTSDAIVNNQVSIIKNLKRPQTFATRRNYASATSLLSKNTDTESIKSNSTASVAAENKLTFKISNIQASTKNAESSTYSNYDSESGSTVNNQETTLKFLRRPQKFATRRNYASRASFKSQNNNTESTRTETANIAFANRQNTRKQSSVEVLDDATKTTAEIDNSNESGSGSRKLFEGSQNFASRRYSASDVSLKSASLGTKRAQSRSENVQIRNNQAKFEKSSVTNMGRSEIVTGYNGDSVITVTDSINTRKFLRRPQYISRQNNSASKASVTSSRTDTGKTLSEITSAQNLDSQVVVGKSLHTNIDRVKTIKADTTYEDKSKFAVNTTQKQNNFATNQYQNSGVSVVSTNIDEKQGSLTTVEKSANDGKTLISDSDTFTGKLENNEKTAIASARETSSTEHTQNAIEKGMTSGELVNAQKSLLTNIAIIAPKVGYNESAGVVLTEDVIPSLIFSNSRTTVSTTDIDLKHLQAESIGNDFNASSSLTDTHHKQSKTKNTAFEDKDIKNAKSLLNNVSKSTGTEVVETISGDQDTIKQSLITNEFSNKKQALNKTNVEFIDKVKKEENSVFTAARSNSKTVKSYDEGSQFLVKNSEITSKVLQRPQNIATRRNSALKDSTTSSIIDTERFQGETNSVRLNKQAKIEKNIHTNTDRTANFTAESNYKKQLQFASKTKESAEQKYFATRQNENSEMTFTTSNIGADLRKNQQINDDASTNYKKLLGKTLYINTGTTTQTSGESTIDNSSSAIFVENTGIVIKSPQSETNDATSFNHQINLTEVLYTDTAKIANTKKIQTENNTRKNKEIKLKPMDSMYTEDTQKATDSIKFAEKQANLQSFSSTNTDQETDTGHTLIESDTNAFAEEHANNEKSILTTNARNRHSGKDDIPDNQENFSEIFTKTTEIFNNGKSGADEGNKASTVNFNSKPKVSPKGRYYSASSLKSKINTQTNNYNVQILTQRNSESSFETSTQQALLDKFKSTVTDKIRSSISLRGQKSYQSSKVESKDQNINVDEKPTKQLFEKSSDKSSIASSEKKVLSINSDTVSQKQIDTLSHVTKVSSAGATSQTIDAKEVQIKDTVVENIQSKPTSANFKINGGVSEELSNLKGENVFTQPQQSYTKISTLTADSAGGYGENTNIKTATEKSSTNQFSAMYGQQQQSDRQQHLTLEGLSDISQTSSRRKSTNISENAKQTSLRAASIKSNERNNENTRAITHRRKISSTKPIETDGINTETKQFTRVTTSRNQPIEFRKEITKTLENPKKRQKVETVTTTVINDSEKESLQTERKHSRNFYSGFTSKPVETTKQILVSNIKPKIKISERPVEASTFTLTKTKSETFNSGTSRRNGFESSAQVTSKPTLITKEVFEEKPVQYSVKISTPEKSRQIIQSRTESSSASWTSTGSHSQTRRFHGDQDPIVPIIEQENRIFTQNGKFKYSYEGGDGTRAFGKGKLKEVSKDHAGEAVEGGFSYTDKDGNDFSLSYTADENGYRPVGAHLPTPPPIPIAIARALAYLATKSTPAPVTEPTRRH